MAPQIKLDFTNLLDILQNSPLLFSAAAVLILVSIIRFFTRPKLNLPIVGRNEDVNHMASVITGVSKYPTSPFVIPSSPPIVILPTNVFNEIRNLPESQVSFQAEIENLFHTKHTGLGNDNDAVVQVVKQDLTRHIASTLDALQDEVRYGFDKEFGPCEDWTKVQLYPKLARIVALLSGRVFVGRPLSRENEWIEATVDYAMLAMKIKLACDRYSQWPLWVQDLILPRLKVVKDFTRFGKRGGELIKPVLDAQLEKDGKEKVCADGEGGFDDEQGTFIRWMMNHMDEGQRRDPHALANVQMSISFAAIHTTTMTAAAVLYDLCAHPECIPFLREEIDTVIAEDGYETHEDGFLKLKKSSIPRLWKLDSFLKESQRFTPPSLLASFRVTTSPLTLSTGHHIPKGVRIAFPAWAVHHPETEPLSSSPSSKPLSEFDPLRYYNLRKQEGESNKHLFVTSSPQSLNFGYGLHTCPGRFFASNEIKVVLIELLRNWDFKFPDGVQRPGNIWTEFQCLPDPTANIEFKRRRKDEN